MTLASSRLTASESSFTAWATLTFTASAGTWSSTGVTGPAWPASGLAKGAGAGGGYHRQGVHHHVVEHGAAVQGHGPHRGVPVPGQGGGVLDAAQPQPGAQPGGHLPARGVLPARTAAGLYLAASCSSAQVKASAAPSE